MQDFQTEKDVDAVMKAKLKDYRRKISQKDRKISSAIVEVERIEKVEARPRPSRLSLSIKQEEETGGESDPLTPQKRHIGELVSR